MESGRIHELLERERTRLDERTRGSAALAVRAREVLAGGVTSSFQAREPWPLFVDRGSGSRVWDVDGNEYVDFHNGFSSMISGHAHPAIGAAVGSRYGQGTHFAAPSEDGVVVAEELARRFGLERWRFTNSGSESTMAAIRIARGLTGRSGVMKIFGSYHGHHDAVMVSIGVELERMGPHDAPHSLPYGAGIPASLVEDVSTVHFNDAESMERLLGELEREGRLPACVILEAAMTNLGVVLPRAGYLEAVRDITRRAGVILIFDEVKTGLTIAAGGATERFGVRPDMVTLAKALGGGLPTGAIGMTAELARVVEDGSVHHFGTFNGNPLGMAAARANLLEVLTPEAYERVFALNERLLAGCDALIAEHQLPAYTVGLGSKGCVTYGTEPVLDYPSYKRREDPELAELIWLWFTNRGCFVTPGREQEWNLTVAHGEESVERYLDAFAEVAGALSASSRPRSGSARA